MPHSSSQEQVAQMFNTISPTYDRTNRILSLGIDQMWRKKMIQHLPNKKGIQLLDLATGTCDQLLLLMQSGKIGSALGIDVAEKMLEIGKKKVARFGERVELKVASALDLPIERETFDCATMTFGIRNVEDPLLCLKEMHRVLRGGGRALILEFSLPENRLIRPFYLFYLRHILPYVGKMVSKNGEAYSYLQRTIQSFPYGEAFCSLMREAGFEKSVAYPLSFGVATLYVGEKL